MVVHTRHRDFKDRMWTTMAVIRSFPVPNTSTCRYCGSAFWTDHCVCFDFCCFATNLETRCYNLPMLTTKRLHVVHSESNITSRGKKQASSHDHTPGPLWLPSSTTLCLPAHPSQTLQHLSQRRRSSRSDLALWLRCWCIGVGRQLLAAHRARVVRLEPRHYAVLMETMRAGQLHDRGALLIVVMAHCAGVTSPCCCLVRRTISGDPCRLGVCSPTGLPRRRYRRVGWWSAVDHEGLGAGTAGANSAARQ